MSSLSGISPKTKLYATLMAFVLSLGASAQQLQSDSTPSVMDQPLMLVTNSTAEVQDTVSVALIADSFLYTNQMITYVNPDLYRSWCGECIVYPPLTFSVSSLVVTSYLPPPSLTVCADSFFVLEPPVTEYAIGLMASAPQSAMKKSVVPCIASAAWELSAAASSTTTVSPEC